MRKTNSIPLTKDQKIILRDAMGSASQIQQQSLDMYAAFKNAEASGGVDALKMNAAVAGLIAATGFTCQALFNACAVILNDPKLMPIIDRTPQPMPGQDNTEAWVEPPVQ